MIRHRLRRVPRARPICAVTLAVVIAGQPLVAIANQSDSVIYPDPAECLIAPRTSAEISKLATPVDPASPRASVTPTRTSVAEGFPTSPWAIQSEATRTILEYVACVNAGDLARFYALFSDRYFAAIIHAFDLSETIGEQIDGAPQTRDGSLRYGITRSELVGAEGSNVFAFIVVVGEEDGREREWGMILALGWEHGRYRVDQVIPVPLDGTPSTTGGLPLTGP